MTIDREGTTVLGRNRFEGTGRELLEDPEVRQHLGG